MSASQQGKPYSELGDRISDLRSHANLARAELARQAGVSASYMGSIERGTSRPAGPTLRRIAGALDTDYTELGVLAGYIIPPEKRPVRIGVCEVRLLDDGQWGVFAKRSLVGVATSREAGVETLNTEIIPRMEWEQKLSVVFWTTAGWLQAAFHLMSLVLLSGSLIAGVLIGLLWWAPWAGLAAGPLAKEGRPDRASYAFFLGLAGSGIFAFLAGDATIEQCGDIFCHWERFGAGER